MDIEIAGTLPNHDSNVVIRGLKVLVKKIIKTEASV